jgi:uncharacterized protein YukJ
MTLVAQSKKPLFICKHINKEQAESLVIVLKNLCPHADFKILALDNSQSKTNWNVDRVHNFHLRQPEPYDWKGDNQAWSDIFKAMGLMMPEEKPNA